MMRPLSTAPRLKAMSTAHRWRTLRQLPSARAVPNWGVVPVTWLTGRCSKPRKPPAFTMPAITARENAAAAAVAGLVFADQLDPGGAECADDLGERVDHAAHGAFAGFHALDGGQGDAGQLGQAALVDAKQGAGGPHLGGSDHGLDCPAS